MNWPTTLESINDWQELTEVTELWTSLVHFHISHHIPAALQLHRLFPECQTKLSERGNNFNYRAERVEDNVVCLDFWHFLCPFGVNCDLKQKTVIWNNGGPRTEHVLQALDWTLTPG